MTVETVSSAEIGRRTILNKDWVPCKAAFIDCRTPGSDRKDNYSFIGPGVSQNVDQFVNLAVPHGFNMGAAGMPNGTINSLHMHFTAEVFINFGGDYQLRWGPEGEQGEYHSVDGDVVSVPPWIFRGFTNIGADDGILLTVLGQDNPGGIIWAPSVLEDAAGHGLYLTAANELIDTVEGDAVLASDEMIKPLPPREIDDLDVITSEQFRARVVHRHDRAWIEKPFLCSDLPGGRAELSLVIGYGMSEDRRSRPTLTEPHSFNLSWLRARTGEGVLTHRHQETQVLTAKAGRWLVRLNRGTSEHTVELSPRDSLSVPPGIWRSVTLVDDVEGTPTDPGLGELLVVNGGDGRTILEWDDSVVAAARAARTVLDPNGYRGPATVVDGATDDD